MKYLMSTVAIGALVAGTSVAHAADPVFLPAVIAPAPEPIVVGPTITITASAVAGIEDNVWFTDLDLGIDIATASGLGFALGVFGYLDFPPAAEQEVGFLATVYKGFGPVTVSAYAGLSWLFQAAERHFLVGGAVEYAGDVVSALLDVSRLWINGAPDDLTIVTELGFAIGPNTTITPAAEFVINGGTTTTLSLALAQTFGNATIIPSVAQELGGPTTISLEVDYALGPATLMAGVDRVLATSWTFWGGISLEFGN